MALVNKPIPALVGGVSQQPATMRHPTQVEQMINFVPSVAVGLRKRTGSQFINKLMSVPNPTAFVHAINRGTTGISERYFVLISKGDLQVFDFRGNPQTVNFPDGKDYISTNVVVERDEFTATTVADYTFIVNKARTPYMVGVAPYTPPNKLFIYMKLAVISQTYYVTLNGTQVTYTSGSTAASTALAAASLQASISAIPGFTCTYDGAGLLIVEKADHSDFTWQVSDSYGNTLMTAFRDTVNRYEELPRHFVAGPIITIRGDPNNANTDWFVTYKPTAANGDGVWVESTKPGVTTQISNDQMPWQLVRNSDATWTFKKATWSSRDTGDDNSNPLPSFIGSQINDVFFYRNRLGFLCDENIILSRAGDYFNFFGASARAQLDSDPIDLGAASTKVTFLRHAIAFDKTLLIFSDNQQFQFGSQEVLSARTAKMEPTTAYASSAHCKPTALGKNVFFVSDRGRNTALREYFLDATTISTDAQDVTSHVPTYLPGYVFKLSSCLPENMVFALSAVTGNVLYVYNSYWHEDQKVQSAWHEWVFSPEDIIISADVFGTTLALTVCRNDGIYLDMMELEEVPYSPTTFNICLDRWVGYQQGVYDTVTKMTTWNLPFPTLTDMQVVVCNTLNDPHNPDPNSPPQVLDGIRPGSAQVTVKGDYSHRLVVIGQKALSVCRPSQLYVRDQEKTTIIDGRLQLRDLTLAYTNTGFFKVMVTPQGRDPYTYTFPAKPLGLNLFKVGQIRLDSGEFKVPIMAKNDEVDIAILSDSALPCVFQSGEFTGNFTMLARRA